jgi:purine nucleoside phosphorylase
MQASVLGISCITNVGAGLSADALSHDDVQLVARGNEARLSRLFSALIEELPSA